MSTIVISETGQSVGVESDETTVVISDGETVSDADVAAEAAARAAQDVILHAELEAEEAARLANQAQQQAAIAALAAGGGLGDMLSTNNLSELSDPTQARDNLGLGTAAVENVTAFASTTELTDLTDSLGNAAFRDVGITNTDVAAGNAPQQAVDAMPSVDTTDAAKAFFDTQDVGGGELVTFLDVSNLASLDDITVGSGDMLAANNLSDLDDLSAARINLGLGTAAVADTADFDLAGTAAALTAADIPFTPQGSIAATDIQTAIQEVRDEAGGAGAVASVNGQTGVVVLDAGDVGFTPVGTIAATDTQAAVAEVSTDAASALSAHAADTTAIHGITDTAALETTTGSQAKVDVHVNDTTAAHVATAIGFTPAGSIGATTVQAAIEEVSAETGSGAAAALAAHEADTTNIHGIVDTTALVLTGDARLSDARTPTAHKTSHQDGGTDELALDASQITTGTHATARLGTGTANSSTFLRGDQTWAAPSGGGGGDLLAANNLSDIASAPTARTNLGLAIGTNVQAQDPDLQTIAGLTATTDNFIQSKAGAWASRTVAQVKTDLAVPSLPIAESDVTNLTTDLAAKETPAGAQAKVDTHVNDTVDAHDASAISVVSTTLVGTGTDVQAVFEELDNAVVAAETATANHLADTTAAHAASAVAFTPNGTIAATDVQAAIQEVRDEAASGSFQPIDSDLTTIATQTNSALGLALLTGTRQTLSDAGGETVLATATKVVQSGTLTAPRTATLPAANAVAAGWRITLIDTSGTPEHGKERIFARAGSDTILHETDRENTTTLVMRAAGSSFEIESDGVSKWTVVNSGGQRQVAFWQTSRDFWIRSGVWTPIPWNFTPTDDFNLSPNFDQFTTTVASGSNGVDLATNPATINVASTTGFPTSGYIVITGPPGSGDDTVVGYTGVTGTSFTGCNSTTTNMQHANLGVGTLATSQAVKGANCRFTLGTPGIYNQVLSIEFDANDTGTRGIRSRAAVASLYLPHCSHTEFTTGEVQNVTVAGQPASYVGGPGSHWSEVYQNSGDPLRLILDGIQAPLFMLCFGASQ